MPYAFAHPAAVVPLAKLLGPRAVPSALAIGSMVPDAWYLVPLLEREDTHMGLGAVAFSLPAGLFAYAAFHLLFKEPLLALLPRSIAARAAGWAVPGLPAVPWHSVLFSLLAGIATHLLWDAFTHRGHFAFVEAALFSDVRIFRVLQHASTLLGSAFLAWWLWRKLRAAAPRPDPPQATPAVRVAVFAAMMVLPAAAFLYTTGAVLEGAYWRTALRAAGVIALSTLGLVALSFCLAWRLSPRLRARPRRRARVFSTARPR
jgi:hypothetical protein